MPQVSRHSIATLLSVIDDLGRQLADRSGDRDYRAGGECPDCAQGVERHKLVARQIATTTSRNDNHPLIATTTSRLRLSAAG